MKTYKHLYEILISDEVRREAAHIVWLKRKKDRYVINNNLTEEDIFEQSLEWIENFHNYKHKPRVIKEGTNNKERIIIRPTVQELMVQHCLVQTLMPMFTKGMYEHTYASIPGRGSHKAKKVIEKWIRDDGKQFRYVLKLDIRKFFDSIPHDKLKAKFHKYIKDEKVLTIIDEIIDVQEKGIPLGFFTSQWFANWYLQDLDHYIKEDLQADKYIRYMDDKVITGSNKRKLFQIKDKIEGYLNNKLGLELKANWQLYRFDYVKKNGKRIGRDIDFMGFRFFRNRTTIRKSILRKARRKALRMSKKPKITIYDCRQMLSYLGWFDCTDSYNYYTKYIKPYVCFRYLKKRISRFDKRMAKEAVA